MLAFRLTKVTLTTIWSRKCNFTGWRPLVYKVNLIRRGISCDRVKERLSLAWKRNRKRWILLKPSTNSCEKLARTTSVIKILSPNTRWCIRRRRRKTISSVCRLVRQQHWLKGLRKMIRWLRNSSISCTQSVREKAWWWMILTKF